MNRLLATACFVVAASAASAQPPVPAPPPPQALPAPPAVPMPVVPGQGVQPAPQVVPPAPVLPSCPELAVVLQNALRNDARLSDWANFGRYRDANLGVAPPKAGDARVVFMGDSITDSWQQPRFGSFFTNPLYVDRGISGQTTPQMLLRFRADVIDLKPKVVVLLAGTNDIAGNTGPMTNEQVQNNLASMADLAKVHGIKVVFASILPVSEYHVRPGDTAPPQTTRRPMARINALNAWIRQYAAANGHTYLDYFTPMADAKGLLRAELSEDDLHPNAQGYAIMAPLAEAAIRTALGTRK